MSFNVLHELPITSPGFTWQRLRGAAEGWIYGDTPLPEEPFRDIAPIPVLLAPRAELTRGGIHRWSELQLPDPQFELGGENGSGLNGTPPVGVAAFASRSDWYRHRPRSYSALGDSAGGISHGRMVTSVKSGSRILQVFVTKKPDVVGLLGACKLYVNAQMVRYRATSSRLSSVTRTVLHDACGISN
jgi:hypothetical protein